MSDALARKGFDWSLLVGLGTPTLLFLMLTMMVLPLPPTLLDLIFTFNIALSMIVLLAAIYASRPLEFSAFPTVLLVATLLRLGLNVASTRVVLMEGHTGPGAAGKVIQAFGEFVVGGSYAVGIVVFAILVIINFVVVTKGAGRISEVTARFTLDAMPGKQMAIDADLNAGLINQDEARMRRDDVAREADFYGAMDGASKFVRGDAVAGILILFINIIGGFAVGVLQHNLSAGEAASNYILLTIGDGLVAQIPSLLLSTATAVIVTRVSDSQDMGHAVLTQLLSSPRVLRVSAMVIGVMGIVPGMPHLVFLSLAAGMGFISYLGISPSSSATEDTPDDIQSLETHAEAQELSWEDVSSVDQVGLEVGYRLISLVDKSQGGELLSRIKGIRKKLSQELGFLIHAVHIRDNLDIGPTEYRISVHDVILGSGEVLPGKELAIDPGQVYGEIQGLRVKDPAFGLDAVWIEAEQRDDAQAMGYTVVDCGTVIATHLSQLIKVHASELLGQDDVQQLLDKLAKNSPKLVENLVPQPLGLGEVTKVMQNLLEEGIPIRDVRTIASALAEHAAKSQDPVALTSHVRVALGRTLFQMVSGSGNEVTVMTLDPKLEQLLLEAIQGGSGGVEPSLIERTVEQVMQVANDFGAQGKTPVLLVSGSTRLFLSKLVRSRAPSVYVMAYEEIPANKTVKAIQTIGGSPALPAAGNKNAT